MDDVYLDRQDPAVTVGLRLHAPGTDLDGALALVWTTTPWTLPSNLAAGRATRTSTTRWSSANGERYLLAAARVGALRPRAGRGADRAAHVPRLRAARPALHPAVRLLRRPGERAPVLAADYVTTEDGTGHRAHRARLR